MANQLSHDSSGFVLKKTEVKSTLETHIENEPTANEASPMTLPEKYSKFTEGSSEFNIQGNYIGQAAIGNTGTVTFNQSVKTYDEGAHRDSYEIKGGNFTQATIGGTSKYNNEGSRIRGHGPKTIDPEQLAMLILEKGITCNQFKRLLEKEYSLPQIAFSVPKDPDLQQRMIDALLLD